MRKRVSRALRSVLRRGETAVSHDRLQQTMIRLKRDFPSMGNELLQLFKQNHYTEWTSAFADLSDACLQEVMKEEETQVAQKCQNQPVSLVLTMSNLARDSQRTLMPHLFLSARLRRRWRSQKHSRSWRKKMVFYHIHRTVRCAVALAVIT